MKSNISLFALVLALTFLGCKDSNYNKEQQNKEVVRQAFATVSDGDIDNMDAYISENYTRNCPATPEVNVRSLSDFKEFLRKDSLSIPDQEIETIKLVAEGDYVAFWAVYKGTQSGQMGPFPPSNKYAELEFSGIHKIQNGKIVESWITWDNIDILSQLGHFPPPPSAGQED